MNFDSFVTSLDSEQEPTELSAPLKAMWLQGKGQWDAAHKVVQDSEGSQAAWVHAHLHRVEGDLQNASYWYKRAQQPVCETTLDEEWQAISKALLTA